MAHGFIGELTLSMLDMPGVLLWCLGGPFLGWCSEFLCQSAPSPDAGALGKMVPSQVFSLLLSSCSQKSGESTLDFKFAPTLFAGDGKGNSSPVSQSNNNGWYSGATDSIIREESTSFLIFGCKPCKFAREMWIFFLDLNAGKWKPWNLLANCCANLGWEKLMKQ